MGCPRNINLSVQHETSSTMIGSWDVIVGIKGFGLLLENLFLIIMHTVQNFTLTQGSMANLNLFFCVSFWVIASFWHGSLCWWRTLLTVDTEEFVSEAVISWQRPFLVVLGFIFNFLFISGISFPFPSWPWHYCCSAKVFFICGQLSNTCTLSCLEMAPRDKSDLSKEALRSVMLLLFYVTFQLQVSSRNAVSVKSGHFNKSWM